MTLGMLLSPHANARYFHSIKQLSIAELSAMNRKIGASEPEYRTIGGLELLCIELADADVMQALPILERHSSCQAVFSVEGELLRPLLLPGNFRFGGDISAILKYKGKTNERFTSLLINIAVCSGVFNENITDKLNLLDPMCGRGTSLFEGLKSGYNVYGIEIDKADVKEANQFLKSYLKYQKIKHTVKQDSMTAQGKPAGARTRFEIDGEWAWTLVCADARHSDALFKQNTFEAIVSDLPYGIQHRSLAGKTRTQIDSLMRDVLPRWHGLLKKGGAIALAFNAHTITLDILRKMLGEAGYEPLVGGAYDGFRHWVEQAVDRDIVVAVRK